SLRMESSSRNSSWNIAVRRDAGGAARHRVLEPWARSARHRLFQSLDDVQREFAIAWVTGTGIVHRIAGKAVKVVSDFVAGAGGDQRRIVAHRRTRVVALVFDFRRADRRARSSLADVVSDQRLRIATDACRNFHPASKTEHRVFRFER